MKKMLKTSLLMVLIAIMLTSVLAMPASAAVGKKVTNAAQSVVRLLVETEDGGMGVGTAFYVGKSEKGKDIFVTNRHMVTDDNYEHCKRIYILKDNSTTVKSTTVVYANSSGYIISYSPPDGLPEAGIYSEGIDVDPSRAISCDILYTAYSEDEPDVAIIEASQNLEGLTPLPLMSPKEAAVGSSVYVLGYPAQSDMSSTISDGYTLVGQVESDVYLYMREEKQILKAATEECTITTGIVSRLTNHEYAGNKKISVIQTDARMNGGNSGGPMITEDGVVIGIATYGLKGENDETMDNYATSIDYAIEQLEELGIKYSKPKSFPVWIIIVIGGVLVLGAAALVILIKMGKVPFCKKVKAQKPACIIGQGGVMDGKRFDMKDEGIKIGRSLDSDVCYPADTAGVSRDHCRLSYQDDKLMITDLNSSSGTYVNGAVRLEADTPTELHVGDTFFLGEETNSFTVT